MVLPALLAAIPFLLDLRGPDKLGRNVAPSVQYRASTKSSLDAPPDCFSKLKGAGEGGRFPPLRPALAETSWQIDNQDRKPTADVQNRTTGLQEEGAPSTDKTRPKRQDASNPELCDGDWP